VEIQKYDTPTFILGRRPYYSFWRRLFSSVYSMRLIWIMRSMEEYVKI